MRRLEHAHWIAGLACIVAGVTLAIWFVVPGALLVVAGIAQQVLALHHRVPTPPPPVQVAPQHHRVK